MVVKPGLRDMLKPTFDKSQKMLTFESSLGLLMVGWQGLEPWTNALKGHCSTN